ncbi:LOW QUALITY PROTEIN: hypothetical protein AAY473_009394 [Plecturocebus cupreus]
MPPLLDDSSYLHQGCRHAGYATVSLPHPHTTEANLLPLDTTSQKYELITLVLAAGQQINTYSDSHYAFHIVYSLSSIWKEQAFLTAKNTRVVNGSLSSKLLQAARLLQKVAIIHSGSHQTPGNPIMVGNALTDQVAKQVALQPVQGQLLFLSSFSPLYSLEEKEDLQAQNRQKQGPWYIKEGRFILPHSQTIPILQSLHSSFHACLRDYPVLLYPPLSVTPGLPPATASSYPPSPRPGTWAGLQTDFTHMPPDKWLLYLLVFDGTFPRWVEAFPTTSEGANIVTQTLNMHIIPHFELPTSI